MPILGLREVFGFLVLGARRARSILADIDFLLLENLCSQLGLALKLRELDKMSNQVEKLVSLGTMAAGLSHELRNPLVSIRTLASLLHKHPENLQLKAAFSETVQRDVKRISGIVEGVSTFAQDAKVRMASVEMKAVLIEAQAALVEELVECNVLLKLDCQSDLITAHGNFEQLIQVLQNIIENGIHAISEWSDRPEQGMIHVHVQMRGNQHRQQKKWVEIDISDNGPGMPTEFQKRIFDPFVTSRDTGSRFGASGTGLGLAIVNKIIEHHGGAITVESTQGKGARFRIALPAAD